MNPILVITTIEKFAPAILEVADALKLNKLAADLVRKLAGALMAEAKKTASTLDDVIAVAVSAALDHVADLLEKGAAQEALALLSALGKLAGPK